MRMFIRRPILSKDFDVVAILDENLEMKIPFEEEPFLRVNIGGILSRGLFLLR